MDSVVDTPIYIWYYWRVSGLRAHAGYAATYCAAAQLVMTRMTRARETQCYCGFVSMTIGAVVVYELLFRAHDYAAEGSDG